MRKCWLCGHARPTSHPWEAVVRHLCGTHEPPATWFVCSKRCKALAHAFIDAVLAGGWGQDGKKAA